MRQTLLCLALATCTGLVAACGSSPHATTTVSPTPRPSGLADATPDEIVAEYLPGLAAHLRFPVADEPAPLIVLVPGGGWSSADPTGLIPLARLLTDAGSTTALITYSTTGDGTTFPEAVDDVACAVRWSANQARSHGRAPTRVVLLGHSAGGHLAALVALSGDEFGRDCPDPPVDIDGLIGLAGIYDTGPFRGFMSQWMGISPTEQPETWERADPVEWLRRGVVTPTGLRALLLHGDEDQSVPLTQTTALRDALNTAGIEVDSTVLAGQDHLEIFEAPNAGPPIVSWMAAWPKP
jgi:acetyl esterase/lipase